MKRDLDLIRALLFHFESKPDDRPELCPLIEGRSKVEIRYHLLLMYEAGFLRCEVERSKTGRAIRVFAFSLTWQGHEFLEASRNAGAWRKAKKIAVDKAGGLSFEVMKALLVELAKSSVGLES